MPIPKTRDELVDRMTARFAALREALDHAGPRAGSAPCVDAWTVKDLLAVRAWWTERVADWIEAGRRGEIPVLPSEGYAWRETPRLNADIVRKSRRESYRAVRQRLERGYRRVLAVVDDLDDAELLDVGAFAWAGTWPVSRWVSINTARQYETARAYVRRATAPSRRRS